MDLILPCDGTLDQIRYATLVDPRGWLRCLRTGVEPHEVGLAPREVSVIVLGVVALTAGCCICAWWRPDPTRTNSFGNRNGNFDDDALCGDEAGIWYACRPAITG